MLIVGVDPGLSGAVAVLDTDLQCVIDGFPMPTVLRGKGTARDISEIALWDNAVGLNARYGHLNPFVFLEFVASSPQMGVASSFKFGVGYGAVRMMVAALGWSHEYVTPGVWKRVMKAPKDKQAARHRASQLLSSSIRWWTPQRNSLTAEQAGGIAEAALIALYGQQWLQERGMLRTDRKRIRLPETAA